MNPLHDYRQLGFAVRASVRCFVLAFAAWVAPASDTLAAVITQGDVAPPIPANNMVAGNLVVRPR